MVNAEKAESFCKEAQAGETSEGTILIVIDNGGFVRYDLSSSDGKIKVDRTNLSWDEEGNPQAKTVDSYQAAAWNYTEKGYLFLELERPAGFDGSSGHTAIRIAPLTEDLRRWNADCIMSIGYAGNNLFTTDWSAENYGDLCFYDLYEPFYKMSLDRRKHLTRK